MLKQPQALQMCYVVLLLSILQPEFYVIIDRGVSAGEFFFKAQYLICMKENKSGIGIKNSSKK